MNKFRRLALGILLAEIIVIALCNVIYINQNGDNSKRLYRVETSRVASMLSEYLEDDPNKSLEQIDLSKYQCILGLEVYDPAVICNDDYVVEEVNGTLYRIRYQMDSSNETLIYIDLALGLIFVISLLALLYISRKIIGPFYRMSDMTVELAKGNLARPIKAEKSRFFGKFLWSMDMLRENLESNKEKELELQKEKKGLLLSLSHDIKTPLSAIELYNKALTQGLYETPQKQAEAYEGISRNISDIKNYVDEIIQAAREDFLDLEIVPGEFYLSSAINTINVYYSEKLGLVHTEFIVDEFDDCIIRGDENRFVEVLQNILENAIKYGDGKGVRISFDDEEDCRLIMISNSGESLPEEELTNVFDSFYRGSNSKGVKGSGLGLYICRNLMKKMDGEVYTEHVENGFKVVVVARK